MRHPVHVLLRLVKYGVPNSVLPRRLSAASPTSVLVTFDDGPYDGVTQDVLARLAKHNARAVFFLVGRRAIRAPDLVRQITREGHVIANHTYEHSPKGARLRFREYLRDVSTCQSVLEDITGQRPSLFRPVGGHISLTGLLTAQRLGLRIVLWSRKGGEWSDNRTTDAVTIGNTLAPTVQPRDIVLLHDDNSKVPAVLDILLPALTERSLDLSAAVGTLG